MRITICASLEFANEVAEAADMLRKAGHQVTVPHPLTPRRNGVTQEEMAQYKISGDLIRRHFKNIELCEAVLVLNLAKEDTEGYVGGNSLMEMGFAHVLRKRIFLLNPIPDMPYAAEIMAMQPDVLHGDIRRVPCSLADDPAQ